MTALRPRSQSDVETKARFLRALLRHGLRSASNYRDRRFVGLTQTQIADEIRLSRPTVSGLVDRAKQDLVSDFGNGLLLDPDRAPVALGFDFGQGHHRVSLTDIHGQPFEPKDPRKFETTTPPGRASLSFDWASKQAESLLETAERAPSDVCAVGVSLPGPVDQTTKKLFASPDKMDSSWQIVDLERDLTSGLELPQPVVDSDYNSSCLAEHLWGAMRDTTDALYVKISQRCACSLLINHRIYRGVDGFAGRLGKTWVIDPNGAGHWDLVEHVFSLPALRQAAGRNLSSSEIVDLAKGDESGPIASALRRGASALGVALAPLIDAVNPQAVVIGGALGSASFAWISSDLLEGIGYLGDGPARAQISARMRGGELPPGTAIRGVIANALLESAPAFLAKQL